MYVLSKNRMQIINLEHVTAMYLGADETSIKEKRSQCRQMKRSEN